MQEIAPEVYVESGYRGVTVGALVAGDGLICIDSPMLPDEARDWRARLFHRTGKPIRYLIYTNAHRDRILGGQYLGGAVIAHHLTAEAMKNYGEAFCQQAAAFLTRYGDNAALELGVVLPQIAFSERLVLYGDSNPVILQHVGGPTPGSLWVILPEHKILFAGDSVTHNVHPDLSEADLEQWLSLLRELNSPRSPAEVIVPGRGGALARKSDLSKLATYLRTVRARVQAALQSRRPRVDMAALAQEFLPRFPVPAEERDRVQRHIRVGLEHVYEWYRSKT